MDKIITLGQKTDKKMMFLYIIEKLSPTTIFKLTTTKLNFTLADINPQVSTSNINRYCSSSSQCKIGLYLLNVVEFQAKLNLKIC